MLSWPQKPIGELCDLINGRAFKPSDWGTEGLPIVRIQNLNDQSKPFNRYNGSYADKHFIDNGAILLSWSGTPGTSFGCFRWLRGPGILNQHIFKVILRDTVIDGDYFLSAVNSRLDEMIRQAHGGVGLRHITKSKLEAIRLPVPKLEEQRRIVARIKECMARVEEIERLRADAIEEAAATLPSMLNNVILHLLNVYERIEIGSLVLETRYGTSKKCSTTPNGTAILRIPNVAKGYVNFTDLKYCLLDNKERQRLILEKGDLLFVRTNGSRDLVGRCAIYEGNGDDSKYGFASYLIRARLDQAKLRPHFLAFFLNSTCGRAELDKRRRTSAGQFNINSENLCNIAIPFPPVEVQDRTVEILLTHQGRVTQLQKELQDARKIESHLRDSILRKAFAGEL
ncbi:MAG TPA: restriction endonuclease subunit S [Thermodesulfobacteriota bacterium]|nr:restriction endonuclease subunit S [Thermodesulfobacteriota bacterium]HNU72867.1 restriction endonuclease subunit S [Thermodesulfobacteriota bacterium]HQO77422.1 restriction endonuclease subunit S [Thermodesulfobacteriota bacterium]